MTSGVSLTVVVNGEPREAEVEPRLILADFLRDTLGLTGTHLGCEHGVCGSCTVLVNGRCVRSCLLLAVQVHGCEVATIEGLSASGVLRRLQEEFSACHALQCGFCTPGLLVTAYAFLEEHRAPTHDDARNAIAGNLCRCTGYAGLVEAIVRSA
jgi:aerobic-type carbon monoxide dehydrogenase small subunit (CoxS/CutS family)